MLELIEKPLIIIFFFTACIYFALLINWTFKNPKRMWQAYLWSLTLGMACWILFAPRTQNLDVISRYFGEFTFSDGFWRIIIISLNIFVVSLSAVYICYCLIKRREIEPCGKVLWIGVMLFSMGPIVSSFLGAVPRVLYGPFFIPLTFTAIYLLPKVDHNWLVRQIKFMLLLFIYGSLIAILISPDWALQTVYPNSILPGINFRLYGLSTHPNILGPIAILYLILNWLYPFYGVNNTVNVTSALAVLILSQSKTSLAIVVIALFWMIASQAWYHKKKGIYRSFLLILSGSIITLLIIMIPIFFQAIERSEYSSILTLTGRTAVWEIAFETWKKYPLFGYGPTFLDLDFRYQSGDRYSWAGQAHNQFLQSLAEAGILGFITLLVYLLIVFFYSIKYVRATKGASVALFIFFGFRNLTEAPLRNYNFDQGFLIHIFIFITILSFARKYTPNQSALKNWPIHPNGSKIKPVVAK